MILMLLLLQVFSSISYGSPQDSALNSGVLKWSSDVRLTYSDLKKILSSHSAEELDETRVSAVQIDCGHENFEGFRKKHQFFYEDSSPYGMDDSPHGYSIVKDPDNEEEKSCKLRAQRNSTRITTFNYRFSPRAFSQLKMKVRVAQGVPGANPKKGGSGKDDSAFQVWFAFIDKTKPLNTIKYEKDLKLFGYYWGDEHEVSGNHVLLSPGELIENYYSRNYYLISLPEAWQIFLNGGKSELGKWHSFERDLYEDLRQAFPTEPVARWNAVSITFQTDSKDVGLTSEAYLKDLRLSTTVSEL